MRILTLFNFDNLLLLDEIAQLNCRIILASFHQLFPVKRYFPSSFFWREKVHTCQQSVTILGIVFRYICSFRLLLEPRRKTLVGYIIITASRHLPGAALKRFLLSLKKWIISSAV